MEYARQQGYVLITEMTDETKPVTRQSVAKVVSRMLKLPDTDIDMTNGCRLGHNVSQMQRRYRQVLCVWYYVRVRR